MVFCEGSLLAGVDASAAQKQPVTKTCSQCGAVLPSSVRVCQFCDSPLTTDSSSFEKAPALNARANLALNVESDSESKSHTTEENTAWRGELSQRVEAYRVRRKKSTPNVAQSQLPFEAAVAELPAQVALEVAETVRGSQVEQEFSFTIAIGRPSKKLIQEHARMEIDVSLPIETNAVSRDSSTVDAAETHAGLYPVASMDDRRIAALVDAGCLLFAYGGFLTLFGSLGGQFTFSKLSAAVCATTLAIVYLQYFTLFTIFGGTTPGMMMRGLQVTSFSGEEPTPRQMLLRSVGYVLSAGTFFLGFFWSMWDEDELTWHDRISRTYLSSAQTFSDMEATTVAHGR